MGSARVGRFETSRSAIRAGTVQGPGPRRQHLRGRILRVTLVGTRIAFMVHDGKPTDLGRIFRFWIPMAGTWLMMALEAPFLAAVIARLDDPKQNLAAFGVAFSVAILVEAPVIMILSASTALVEGPVSYRMLRRFTYVLNLALTAVMLAMLVTPLWRSFAAHAIGLPPEVVELTQWVLLLMVPWPAAIGYRRFYHGLLIRHGLTRLVAYGTATRLLTMALTSLFLFAMTENLIQAKI